MRKKLCKILAIVLAFGISFSCVQPYDAAKREKTVKLGVYQMDGFHYYDEYNVLRGYCIDYLNVISSITGWNYEYVEVTDFMDGCQKLKSKEIDLLAPAMMTEQRSATFDYSELDFGTEYTVLVTGQGRKELYYEDFESFSNMKVAVLNGYPLTEYFIAYMDSHGFDADLVYYDTIEESNEALRNGEVDAIVTSIMDMRDDQKLLARFSPQPFYFLTWKGNTDMLLELNTAMNQVQNTYPTLLDELLVDYYPIYELQFFSREEMEYVTQRKEPLKVAYISDRMPLSFADENGELAGISRGIFDRISQISGLKFEYVALPTGDITYKYLLEQQIDLITCVQYNSVNLNSKGILLSTPYLSAQKVLVSNHIFEYDETKTYKVGLATGSQTEKQVFASRYPNFEIIDYETNEECYEALYDGHVDLLIQNQYVAEAMLKKPIYEYLEVIPMEGFMDEFCFSTVVSMYGIDGMDEEESRLLLSILNKSISQIPETEISNIVLSESLEHQYELTFFDVLYVYRLLIGVSFVGLIIILAFAYRYWSSKRRLQVQKENEARREAVQQRRYKTILECSDDMIYEISLDGESSTGSDKIREKFGWEIPREVDDLDVAKIVKILHVHPEDEKAFCMTMSSEETGNFDELTLRLGKVDGSYIWCKVSRSLLMDENNNIISILGKIVDINEEMQEKKQLEIRTRTDGLTGLLNKATFEKEVRDYVENNSVVNAAFVFLDMDHFKSINDKFGHGIGDLVIKEVAKKIQLLFSNFDVIGRFGGDEFCIFVKEIPREKLIDKLKFAVKKMEFEYQHEEAIIKLSASIGAAYCKREHATYREMMDVADAAAYNAKDNGRNCYIIKDME